MDCLLPVQYLLPSVSIEQTPLARTMELNGVFVTLLVYAMTLNPHGTDRIVFVARLLQFSLSPNVFYNILTIYSALQLIHALAVVLYISNITTQCSY